MSERVYITSQRLNGIGDIILNVSSKTKIYDVQKIRVLIILSTISKKMKRSMLIRLTS